jgi:hypothetical protein
MSKACTGFLQADEPGDFVLATGEARSVREFVESAFAEVGRRIEWRGKGVEETGVDAKSGKTVVRVTYFRPTEVELLVGDASKARHGIAAWSQCAGAAARAGRYRAADIGETGTRFAGSICRDRLVRGQAPAGCISGGGESRRYGRRQYLTCRIHLRQT